MEILGFQHPGWLSNSWLVFEPGERAAVLIDAGAPFESVLAELEARELDLRYVLNTHHHYDHVCENPRYRERFDCEVLAHRSEAERVPACTGSLADGERLRCGGLELETLHIPGHTCGQLAFLIEGQACFTGDTLFAGSVGGTRGPGHTSLEDLRCSIMERLMALLPETDLYPGHAGVTTVADEWQQNPFIRAFRGLDELISEPCRAYGEPAILKLFSEDYDGGYKAWVRFCNDRGAQAEAIVAGSKVERGQA